MIDISLNDDFFITDYLEAAIQELDMLFNTENTELIGDTDYGTNWEQFLWQLTPMTVAITDYIYEKLNETLFLKSFFDTTVNVQFARGTERSIYYIQISIYKKNTEEQVAEQQYTID